MSSQRRPMVIPSTASGITAFGLVILIVPLASIWYLSRNSNGPIEDDRDLDDDSSTDDDDLASGHNTDWKNGHSPDKRMAPNSPTNLPTDIPKAHNYGRPKVEEFDCAVTCAAGISASGLDIHRHGHITSLSTDNGGGSGAELVNAGTMQVKGIRSVRGDFGDYMSRE